jgi:hypothetical protein
MAVPFRKLIYGSDVIRVTSSQIVTEPLLGTGKREVLCCLLGCARGSGNQTRRVKLPTGRALYRSFPKLDDRRTLRRNIATCFRC